MYYESESIAVLQGTGAGRTLYEGGTDAVDYAAVFKPCNLTAGAGAWHACAAHSGGQWQQAWNYTSGIYIYDGK